MASLLNFFRRQITLVNNWGPSRITGILRIRNEELILKDTLDHLSSIVDKIIVFDDCSTDSTLDILKAHPSVSIIVHNKVWETGRDKRINAETLHRRKLLKEAHRYHPETEWFLCADADERFEGNIRADLLRGELSSYDGVRISLFDAYITPLDQRPFTTGDTLFNFRKYFGPEVRDILMIWKNRPEAEYIGVDAREPTIHSDKIVTRYLCQHYGKSLSIDQWEETCDYYAKHFPFETYGKKWLQRKGRAIHSQSDFGNALYQWGPDLFKHKTTLV